ncbi:MAG: DEAD/DEAH box helicase, partial [Halieaceae bacterium]
MRVQFSSLNLDKTVQRGIDALGFEFCSPIQGQILPHTLAGNDAIGKAQTGTGKTAAFLITIFNDLLSHSIDGERFLGEPRAVIIAPTRELVMQIAADAEELGRFTGLRTVTLIGGADYQKQLGKVNGAPVDIIVATPGRLIDFMERRDLALDRVEILVLDEADRMLDMGFIPQVKRIVRATPHKEDRQTLLFSATFTQDILNLAKQWTYEPVTVEIEPERVATASVDQRVYLVASRERFSVLMDLLDAADVERIIIFANRRDQVRRLYEKLRKVGVQCGMLSGEITQAKRTRTLENFKLGRTKVLV